MDDTEYMLTTVDNPFDPFTQWSEWFAFDIAAGHDTCSILARLTHTSEELSDVDQATALRLAIDEVVRENVSGVHRKVTRGQVNALNK
jgi:hypothetical protein